MGGWFSGWLWGKIEGMLLEKVEKTIERYAMLSAGQRVGVAVSGGVDSMVVLHILTELARRWGLELTVCHLNHNLRGEESLRDAHFVKRVAERLGLKLVSRTLRQGTMPPGVSTQSWARGERLGFFHETIKKHALHRMALGHNMDDNAETILMRLIRGTSLEGLKGIEPVRGPFVRPLIEVRREEIEEFARGHSIEYVEDSTNRSTRYLRNRIRLELLPYLKAHYNPSIVETLSRISGLLRRDAHYMEGQATELFERLATVNKEEVRFRRRELLCVDEALLARLFLKAVETLCHRRDLMETPQVEEFLWALRTERPNLTVSLGGGLYLKRVYGEIVVSMGRPSGTPVPEETMLKVPGVTTIKGTGYLLKTEVVARPERLNEGRNVAYFDYEYLPRHLVVRTFRPGDRIHPLGMDGTKKLKELFIDEKLPLEERRRIPVVVADGRIIWVAGMRQSEEFRVRDDTRKVLRIELLREDRP